MKVKVMIGGFIAGAAVKAAVAATVTLAPGDGVVTNVMQLFSGGTALAVNPGTSGGGIVKLNAANGHSGGTSLGCGTLVMAGPRSTGRSEVGVNGLTIGAGTLRYAGPAGGVFEQDVASSFAQGSTAATVFDVQSDLVFSGNWNQPYGGFIKTGPGTLTIAGGTNADVTNFFGAVDTTGGTGVFTSETLFQKLTFNANGDSPTVGYGAFSVAEGTFRIDGGVNVFGTETETSALQIGAWTTDDGAEKSAVLEINGGTNTFVGKVAIGRQNGNSVTAPGGNVSGIRVTGGDTTFCKQLHFGWNDNATVYPNQCVRPFYEQTGGTVTKTGGNVQFAYTKGACGLFKMTGGTFDTGNLNALAGYSSGPVTQTVDIAGTAVMKNIDVLYLHSNAKSGGLLDVNVHDGGALGFAGINDATSGGKVNLRVDGGTLRNDKAGASQRTGVEWLRASVDSFSVGPGGVTFACEKGASAGTARILKACTADPGDGSEPAGATFSGGWWQIEAALGYAGPTLVKKGTTLGLLSGGSLPEGSAVTVESGGILRVFSGAGSVSSLTLENAATLAFCDTGSLAVTGALSLPARVNVSMFSGTARDASPLSDEGTYQILSAPAACASAMTRVEWVANNLPSGKEARFAVTTSGTTATLSMTIAAAPAEGDNIVVAAGETLAVAGAVSVGSGSITVNGTMVVPGTLDGTAAGGTVTVNDGGVLDVTGNIRPSNAEGGRFDLYVNEGGTLRARQINVSSSLAATAANTIHFDGATVYPIAAATGDDNRYFPRYATAYIGAKGVTFDLSDWDADGRTGWYRFSCMGHLDTDPALNGAPDGGITIRGTPDGTAIFYFGSGFTGATLNGGIFVEAGGKISSGAQALAEASVTLLPGSMFKAYDTSTTAVLQSLTIGEANATDAVLLQQTTQIATPAFAVESLSVLSPVEHSTFKTSWRYDASVQAGTFTALVYRTAAPAIDTSLFRLPAEYASDYSLSAETVALTGGTYAGYTAVVVTVSKVARDNLELKSGETETQTLSADAVYGNIYVGDFNVVGNPVLTVNGGDIQANELHLAYLPADGATSSDKHTCSYVQNGGTVSVASLYSTWRDNNSSKAGRVNSALTLNGGTLDVSGDVRLGHGWIRQGYSATIAMNGGAMTVGGKMYLTSYTKATAQQGIILMNAGTLDVAGVIDLSSGENNVGETYKKDGGVFLRGGVLSAKNIMQGAATTPWQRLVFDGGLYEPNAAADGQTLTGLSRAHVSANGAIVSTARLPAGGTYTIAQNLLRDPNLAADAVDGGFSKRGAGTLALTGENTFTGPTVVEAGTLVVSGGDAISDDVTVADGAALDLGGSSVTLGRIAASGVIVNGSLSVTGSVAAAEGSLLNVAGDLTLVPGLVVDFAGGNVAGWRPLAAVSGTVAVPTMLKARNAGEFNRCKTSVIDGVVYVCPTSAGFMFSVR